MNDLVINHNGIPATTQNKVSELTDNNEQSVQRLIRTYKADLEEFGELGFYNIQIQAGFGLTYKKVYCLNEQQATLLLTYMKNTPKVREAKKILVKAFYNMKQKLYNNQINGYKSQISQHNKQIQVLKAQLVVAKSKQPKFDPTDPKFKPFSSSHPSYMELFKAYIDVCGNNNALKILAKDYKEKLIKEKEIALSLAKVQKQLEKSHTTIGAVISYIHGNNSYFLEKK